MVSPKSFHPQTCKLIVYYPLLQNRVAGFLGDMTLEKPVFNTYIETKFVLGRDSPARSRVAHTLAFRGSGFGFRVQFVLSGVRVWGFGSNSFRVGFGFRVSGPIRFERVRVSGFGSTSF